MPFPRARFSIGTILIAITASAIVSRVIALKSKPDHIGYSGEWALLMTSTVALVWYSGHLYWRRRDRASLHGWAEVYWRGRADDTRLERIEAADTGDLGRVEDLGLVIAICRERADWHAERRRKLDRPPFLPRRPDVGDRGCDA